jgi:DedD protein
MDSRAKQRLTGAVILVAVFVLFVPELLTGPRKTAPADTAADEGLRRYTIDLDSPTNPVSSPAQPVVALPPVAAPLHPATATPGENAAPEPDAADNSSHAASPSDLPQPARPPPQGSANPGRAAPATNNVAAAMPAAVKPAAPAATPAPSVEPARVTPAAPPERGSFAVQLGSFVSRDNADRLVRDMTAKGFAAFVAPITSNGRELYRVRVGPARDRSSAEELAVQLRRVGQTGSIVPIS